MKLVIKGLLYEKNKTILAVLSIVISVSLCIAAMITITSIKEQYRSNANEQSSYADLIATATFESLISNTKDTIEELDDIIERFTRYYEKEVYYLPTDKVDEYVYLLLKVVDIEQEQAISNFKLVEGEMSANANSCAITQKLSDQYQIDIGEKISVFNGSEIEDFLITGIAENTGLGDDNLNRCIFASIDNYAGIGQITYKLNINDDNSLKDIKEIASERVKDRYRIDYSAGKSEEFLEGMEVLFEGLMGFGILAFILSAYFIYFLVRDYIENMKKTFAIIKVLGTTRTGIVRLVLGRVSIIAVLGIGLGSILGTGFALILIKLVSRWSDSGSQDIMVSYNISLIFSVLALAAVFLIAIVIPITIRSANEKILDGFKYHNQDKKSIKVKSILILILLLIFALFLQNFEFMNLIGRLAAIFIFILLSTKLIYALCANIVYQLLVRIRPLNAFVIKRGLVMDKNKSANMIAVFSIVLAFTLGIFITITGFIGSITKVSETILVGDIIVQTDDLELLESLNSVKEIQVNYNKYIDINDTDVKIRGVYINTLANWIVTNGEIDKIFSEEGVAVSEGLLKRLDLEIGDNIQLQKEEASIVLPIVAAVASMEHDGKIILISDTLFNELYSDYAINIVSIYGDEEKVIDELESVELGSHINIQSLSEAQREYLDNNSSLINLFYVLIIIMFFAGILITINSMLMLIGRSSYSISIEKSLGIVRRELMSSYCISALVYSIFSALIGILAGIAIGLTFINLLNKASVYYLDFSLNYMTVAIFILVSIFVMIVSTLVSVIAKYKVLLKYSLNMI